MRLWRRFWIQRVLTVALLVLFEVLWVSHLQAQSDRGPRDFGEVVFVSPAVGWLYGGELLGTSDGGRTWAIQRGWDSDGGIPRQMQFVDPQHGWVLYESSYLHRTIDGGGSWQAIRVLARDRTSSYPIGLGRLLMVSPQIGFGLGDVGTHLLRTSDGGITWHATLIRQGEVNFTALSFLDGKQGWVAGIRGMLAMTRDGGRTLHDLPATPIDTPGHMQFISVTTGWTLDLQGFRMFRTTDGGQSWQACNPGQPAPVIYGFFFQSATQGWAAAVGGVVLRTTDGCATWQAIQTPSTADLNAVHFLDATEGWVAGNDGAFLKTADGGLT